MFRSLSYCDFLEQEIASRTVRRRVHQTVLQKVHDDLTLPARAQREPDSTRMCGSNGTCELSRLSARFPGRNPRASPVAASVLSPAGNDSHAARLPSEAGSARVLTPTLRGAGS